METPTVHNPGQQPPDSRFGEGVFFVEKTYVFEKVCITHCKKLGLLNKVMFWLRLVLKVSGIHRKKTACLKHALRNVLKSL